jgi:TonB family protein
MFAHGARTATCALDVEVRWGDGELLASEHLRELVRYRLRTDALAAHERGFVVQPAWLCADAKADGMTLASAEGDLVNVFPVTGATQTLRMGEQTLVHVGPLVFRFAVVAPRWNGSPGFLQTLSPRPHAWTFASFALHALALGCMMLMPPKASSLSLDLMSEDTRYMRYLSTPVTRDEADLPWTSQDGARAEGETSKKHAGEEGKAGDDKAAKTDRRMAVQGRDDRREVARTVSAHEAQQAGVLGVLAAASSTLGPSSPFAADKPLGYDPVGALGALFGNTIGENQGAGGLGMRSTGRGGGGDARGTVGVGTLNTGDGARGAPGAHGWSAPRREARVPVLRQHEADVHGSLSKEVIRRTIQRRLNEVRYCYESGLARDPSLSGRLAVSFLIAPSGVVQQTAIAESTLGNRAVSDCVAAAVRRLSFPAPEGGGYVRVTYPFSFTASE